MTCPDRFIRYEYGEGAAFDTNGLPIFAGRETQQTKKSVFQGVNGTGTKLEETISEYNLQGRLDTMTIDSNGDVNPDKKTEYQYDSEELRIREKETLYTYDGSCSESYNHKAYIFDSQNPTGLPQIREKLNYSIGTDSKIYFSIHSTYLLGLDILGQADSSTNNYNIFLCDGHGSTRAIVTPYGSIMPAMDSSSPVTIYHLVYDAYGNPLNFDPAKAVTSILYSGEQTDSTGLQYLRARYYDPRTGRFNSLDPFAGNMEDPQSLHKYLYCHANPVNGIDPTGLSNVPGEVYYRVGTNVHYLFSAYAYRLGISKTPGCTLGTILPDSFPKGNQYASCKPDLVDTINKCYYELKPVTWSKDDSKQNDLDKQMKPYDNALKPFGYQRGNSLNLTCKLSKIPLGKVRDGNDTYLVSLLPAPLILLPSQKNGRGILWYELDKVPDNDDDDDKMKRIPLPKGLNLPNTVSDKIELYDYDYGNRTRNHSLRPDYVPYVALVASYIATRYYLKSLAAQSAKTVIDITILEMDLYRAMAGKAA